MDFNRQLLGNPVRPVRPSSENGSEIVLFDINRTAKFGPLLRQGSSYVLDRLIPAGPQRFRTTVVTNASAWRRWCRRGSLSRRLHRPHRRSGLSYPRDVYSLSHVALPFPVHDGLYGTQPDLADDFGVRLGTLAARGEVGVLMINLESS